jgi:hypothetical protein
MPSTFDDEVPSFAKMPSVWGRQNQRPKGCGFTTKIAPAKPFGTVQPWLKYACEETSLAGILACFAPGWLGFVHRTTAASTNSHPASISDESFKAANAATACCFLCLNPNFHRFPPDCRHSHAAADFERLFNIW